VDIAVSYEWGRPTLTRQILIDRKTHLVREYLYNCLVMSSHSTRKETFRASVAGHWSRTEDQEQESTLLLVAEATAFRGAFWIDQICIDQNNVSEKGPQVQVMSYIATASKVMSWFGMDTEIVRLET
jgi:hypothetical protein